MRPKQARSAVLGSAVRPSGNFRLGKLGSYYSQMNRFLIEKHVQSLERLLPSATLTRDAPHRARASAIDRGVAQGSIFPLFVHRRSASARSLRESKYRTESIT
jgi:hypothetical protein